MVPTYFTTLRPVEQMTKTITETISMTETRTIGTVMPPLTSTVVSTYFEQVYRTVTVTAGTVQHVETSHLFLQRPASITTLHAVLKNWETDDAVTVRTDFDEYYFVLKIYYHYYFTCDED